jgi:hypothetical protein
VGSREPEFVTELYRRVRLAILDAERVVAQSRALASMRRVLGDDRLLVRRCAWCERFTSDEEWMSEAKLPRFVPTGAIESATHTICPDCERRLAREGKSVSTAHAGETRV